MVPKHQPGRLKMGRQSNPITTMGVIAVGLLALGVSASAQAGTVPAAGDTFVRDGTYANTNYGYTTPMEAKTEVPDWNRDAYLKFDLSGQGNISSAVLTFYGATDTSGATIQTNVYAVKDSGWNESQMTWSNRPALGGQVASISVSGTSIAKYTVDLTSYVKAQQAAGKTLVSIALHNAVSSNVRLLLSSREDSSRAPFLAVTANPMSSDPVTASSAADGFVRDGSYAGNNYGSSNPMEVKTEVKDWNRDAYLKFDTSGTNSVSSAVLTLYAATDTAGATLATDIYSVASADWSESGLTWTNRPAFANRIATLTASGTEFKKYTIDLSDYVNSERAAGRSMVAIALHNAAASNVRLFVKSREDSSFKPTLAMNGTVTSPTPAPSGKHYYVSTSGSDSGSGTQVSPWRTINKALNAVRGGGTLSSIIHVAPGTYNENVYVPSSYSGTSSARTYLISDTKWGAKVRATSDAAVTNKANYFDLIGFDVSGTSRIGIHNDPSIGYARVIGNRVHDILATGCSSSGGAGILSDYWSGGKNLDVIGNHVYNIGPSSCNTVQGIYFSTKGGKIQNNVVGRVAAWGIHMWHEATDVTITNNVVFNAASGGIVVGAGESSVTAVNCHVHNNIVRDTPYGIYEYGNVGSGNSYSNNLVFNTTYGIKVKSAPVSSTVTSDPQFVNYQTNGSGDYHLQSSSPAVNKGTTNYAPANDFDGAARPQGGAIDIGAFER